MYYIANQRISLTCSQQCAVNVLAVASPVLGLIGTEDLSHQDQTYQHGHHVFRNKMHYKISRKCKKKTKKT